MRQNARLARLDSDRVLRCLPDTIFLLDRRGTVLARLGAEPAAGCPLDHASAGQGLPEIWSDAGTDLVRLARRVLSTRSTQQTRIVLRDDTRADDANDRRYDVRLLVYGREQVLAVFRDITDAADTTAGARVDPATDLPTRDRFVDQLNESIGQAQLKERSLAVLHIDIDDFSQIIQTYGKDVADALLAEVAARLGDCLRESDRVAAVGRGDRARGAAAIGGAGFGVILTDVDRREYAAEVAARARTAFLHYFKVMGRQIRLTPSVGIALWPKDGRDPDSLLRAATAAVTEARMHNADGQQFYSDTIPMRAEKRLDMGAELRWAIESDQLELHYQPRFEMSSLRMSAVDALLRWEHPVRGYVPLSELLPLAESTGQLEQIGNWVLRRACEQLKQWRDEDCDIARVSVNLARQQLSCEQLSEQVLSLLEALALPGDCLELELTERMLLKVRGGEVQLSRLQDAGVSITLDSFGTGYSSLRELSRLPVRAVKIDRSFVTELEGGGEAPAICAAAVGLARAFGLRVMAEGVESIAQLDHLRSLGCHEIQGFLFSRPLPAERLIDLYLRQANGELCFDPTAFGDDAAAAAAG